MLDISKHWSTVTKTLQDGLLVIDPAGIIVSVNPAGEKLTGYTAHQLVGRSCRILNCTGCKVFNRGTGVDYCGLFRIGEVRSKRCSITNSRGETVEVLKRAAVLKGDNDELLGAVETLTDLREMNRKDEQISALRRTLAGQDGFHGLIGASTAMNRLTGLIETVAASSAPVLIQGQSGTGKELVAQAIHNLGPRRERPFIRVNCAALNENLLESELFGHVKGSFTGADRERIGRFEAASGGDLLLDEIGDLPLSTQVKLLRVLEEKEIERVGDHRPIAVDVRIIAATNRNLKELIDQGMFREELYYRIDVVPLHVPPLAERRSDIPLLVSSFVAAGSARDGKAISGLTPRAMEVVTGYHWPGNVRELKHALEYAVVICPQGMIDLEHLPPKLQAPLQGTENGSGFAAAPDQNSRMCSQLAEVLRRTKGNQTRAAELLGVTRVTIWNRLRKCGLDARDFKR